MSAFLLPNAGRGQEPNRVRYGRLVYNIWALSACARVRVRVGGGHALEVRQLHAATLDLRRRYLSSK